jgi:hypothetical protein
MNRLGVWEVGTGSRVKVPLANATLNSVDSSAYFPAKETHDNLLSAERLGDF